MKSIYKTALIISVLVAVWVYITIGYPHLNLIPWVGFVAWAAYFAAGGTTKAAKCSFIAGVVAILLTAFILYMVKLAGGSLTSMLILIPILSFILVSMAQFKNLSYTPGAFLGAACFFGTGGNVDQSILFILLSWISGIILGIVSVNLDKLTTFAKR